MPLRVVRGELGDLAQGVIQQVNVGRVMNIGLDYKGVTTSG